MRELVGRGPVATARVSELEVASAVARRTREGSIPEDERDRILAGLSRDFEAFYVVELTPSVVHRGRELLLRHPLRAADAVQLASCLELQAQLGRAVPFAAFDRRLLAVARAEGLEPAPR